MIIFYDLPEKSINIFQMNVQKLSKLNTSAENYYYIFL